ncbi:MAG: TraR/DksA C4-type zinc finger protein, partial [Bacillota bacterium]|nr:TraR/DksA C4-type zinc finger protein [Bacillota bacterium]
MLTNNQLEKLKHLLEEDKMALTEQVKVKNQYNDEDNSLSETVGELSAYDNHPADLGTELHEREKEIALEDHQDGELEKINEALKAIKEGSYGKCKECGEDIPYERLEAIPSSLYCVEHSPDQTIADDRPVEEEILEPPGVNSFQRSKNDGVIDKEDSFEEVARFGTSETPADLAGDYDSYSELYAKGKNQETYTEDYEDYAATDITGKERSTYPSEKREEYEH